jgi:hypothetical protein
MVTWYWIENSISQECNGIRSNALFASAIVLYVNIPLHSLCFRSIESVKMCVFILILNGVLINCSWKSNISLFWYYIKQIMNVFIRAMVRIFSFGERWNVPFNSAVASLNGTFHLSPKENILTIARIKTFIICILYNLCMMHNLIHWRRYEQSPCSYQQKRWHLWYVPKKQLTLFMPLQI